MENEAGESNNYHKPRILMIHRIEMKPQSIPQIYHDRGMVVPIELLIDVITRLLDKGLRPGSIKEAVHDSNIFHISFDDGYSEQLTVCKELHQRLNISKSSMTVAVNVGNSINRVYTGMDVLYYAILMNQSEILNRFFLDSSGETELFSIERYKEVSMNNDPNWHIKINNEISHLHDQLSGVYLSSSEILELDQFASIASHGVSHRDLRHHQKESRVEIQQSKKILESLLGHEISVFCYPEGKSDSSLHHMCRDVGYSIGLSIRHENNEDFCVGRYCVIRHIQELWRSLNG